MPAPKLKSTSALFTEKAAGPQVWAAGEHVRGAALRGRLFSESCSLLPAWSVLWGTLGRSPRCWPARGHLSVAVGSASGCRRWDPPASKDSVVLRTEVQGRTFVSSSSQLCSLPGRCHLPYRLSGDQEGEPPVPKVCSAGASFLWSPGRQQPVLDFFLSAPSRHEVCEEWPRRAGQALGRRLCSPGCGPRLGAGSSGTAGRQPWWLGALAGVA